MKFEIVPPTIEDSHDNLHEASLNWDATGADSVLIDDITQPLVGTRKLIGRPLGIETHTFKAKKTVITETPLTATLTVKSHHHDPDPQPEPNPHPDDPEKQKEHLAMLALVPRDQATSIVVNSGLWTNPLTWHNGILPGTGSKILVPVDKNLSVDSKIPVRIKWLRVDGTLVFLIDRDTELLVDTIIGDTTSRLIINVTNPNIKTSIIITDDGPIDLINDPFMLGRGIIWHGKVEAQGAFKSTWSEHNPTKINDQIVIVDNTTEWQIGDKLVFGKNVVEYFQYAHHIRNRDDVCIITEINGNTVHLNRTLTYEHNSVKANIPEPVEQRPIVVNLTRNVTITSESTVIDRRGHVMFMHNPNVFVKYIGFVNLGRTDKSKQITDPNGLGGGLTNPRGRYSLHFHRTGINSVAILAEGNAIDNNPGWGFVNHDSNVSAKYNVGFEGFGAMFVTELGTEKGEFVSNCVIRMNGIGSISGNGRLNDVGFHGDGFWIEGQYTPLIGNVAIACKNSGFTFFSMYGDGVTFKNNISLFQVTSLILWDVGGNGNDTAPPHNMVEDNFLQGGIGQGYISRITYKNNTIVALDPNVSGWGFGHTGVNTRISMINNRVVGFQIGVGMMTQGHNLVQGGYYDNLQVNLQVMNTQQTNQRRIDIEGVSFGNRAEWNIDMTISFFSYSLMPAYPRGPYMSQAALWPPASIFAKPNVAIGHPFSQVRLDGKNLYFEEQGDDFKLGALLTRFPPEYRFKPNTTELETTASLATRGLIVGGEPLPNGTQSHLPKVRGILVEV